MGFLVLVVALVIALFCAGGWFVVGMAIRNEGRTKRHVAAADETLDALLADRPVQVVYCAPDTSGGIPIEVLAEKASARGYRVVSETGDMYARRVILERASS